MLNVWNSHRLEVLADHLAGVLRESPLPPFEDELVVVPGSGMRRWLTYALAERLGVCAGVKFAFPSEFFLGLANTQSREISDARLDWDVAVLAWRIYSILSTALTTNGLEPLQRHLERRTGKLAMWRLANEVAKVMDRYLIYRSEVLSTWERGESAIPEDDWQSVLWRLIRRGVDTQPPYRMLLRGLHDESAFPKRVTLFSTGWLAPLFLQVLHALSEHTEVNLYLLVPTEHYLGYQRRCDARKALLQSASTERDREAGHPLVGLQWGPGRELAEALLDLESDVWDYLGEDETDDPAATVLGALQRDMRQLALPSIPHLIAPEDRSVQVHACPNAAREVEILHDALLDLFEHLPGLRPRDILIASPDAETYGPLVQAIFSANRGKPLAHERREIPVSMADLSPLATHAAARALEAVFALHASRLEVSRVLALLEFQPVRETFDLTPEDLPVLRELVRRSGIHWGNDAKERAAHDVGTFKEGSWRPGLGNLLLGCVMDRTDRPYDAFREFAPLDGIEGEFAILAAKLSALYETLHRTRTEFVEAKSARRWLETLQRVAVDLFGPTSGWGNGEQETMAAVAHWAAAAERGIGDLVIPFDLVAPPILEMLSEAPHSHAFLSDSATFCTLQPLRSVPFRVICLLGLNDGTMPRNPARPSFDLMMARRHRGDPDPRGEDRQLFLEMLISARDAVVVTYSDRHGTQPSPPAAVVAEFLEVLDRSFEWRDRDGRTHGAARQRITKRHPLHAHDAAYFTGEQLFTYEPTHAVVRNRGKRLFHEYLGGSELPPMPCEGLTLDDLSGALANPVRCLFERRFRVTLPHDEVLLADDEPWDLRPLDRAALARNLTDALQTGAAYEAVANRAQALSKVAPGEIGRSDLEEVRRLTVRQGRYLEAHQLLNSPVAQIPIRISGPPLPCPLEGRIALAGDATLVQRRFGSRHAQHLLGNWILHLAACCQLGSQIRTRLLFKDEVIIFTAPEDPASLLAALCETALAAHRELIPFSPNPSLKYVERMLEPKKSKTPHETALQEAAASWQVEAERDSWASICAPGYSPVDSSEFGPLARKLLEPLLNQMATESYP